MRMNEPQGVQIDWAAQIKAGGFMMYPLYLLGLLALVIVFSWGKRFAKFSREKEDLATKGLRKTVSLCLCTRRFEKARGLQPVINHTPSTLKIRCGLFLSFEHVKAGEKPRTATAGDMGRT